MFLLRQKHIFVFYLCTALNQMSKISFYMALFICVCVFPSTHNISYGLLHDTYFAKLVKFIHLMYFKAH
jgi:hypothetical protein